MKNVIISKYFFSIPSNAVPSKIFELTLILRAFLEELVDEIITLLGLVSLS
jgi:hypothetical protein